MIGRDVQKNNRGGVSKICDFLLVFSAAAVGIFLSVLVCCGVNKFALIQGKQMLKLVIPR